MAWTSWRQSKLRNLRGIKIKPFKYGKLFDNNAVDTKEGKLILITAIISFW